MATWRGKANELPWPNNSSWIYDYNTAGLKVCCNVYYRRYPQEFAMFYSEHRMQSHFFFKLTAILDSYNNIIIHNNFPRFLEGVFQMHEASLLMQEVQWRISSWGVKNVTVSCYLEQRSTQVADGEGYGDGRLLSLQQRDGVEEDQVTRDDQQ